MLKAESKYFDLWKIKTHVIIKYTWRVLSAPSFLLSPCFSVITMPLLYIYQSQLTISLEGMALFKNKKKKVG